MNVNRVHSPLQIPREIDWGNPRRGAVPRADTGATPIPTTLAVFGVQRFSAAFFACEWLKTKNKKKRRKSAALQKSQKPAPPNLVFDTT